MSNKALNWVKKLPLKPGEKSVLRVLADSYNDKKGYCYPTQEKIAEWCGYSIATVKRHLKSLISKNLVQKIEDVRNQFGHRVTSKYTMIFDQKMNFLGIILSCGQLKSLSIILYALSIILYKPKYQNKTCALYNKPYLNQRETEESLVDNFNEQETGTILGLKFREIIKINDDTFDLKIAKKLFREECLKFERPIERADQLVKFRQYQVDRHRELSKKYKMPGLPGIKKWIEGDRWNDEIKPFELKKKVSPFIRCRRCGEEYLKGSYCNVCAERMKPRMKVYA